MNRVFFTLALLVPMAVACDKSGAEAQREADKAQAKANTEITNAQVEADKKTANAQAEADKKIATAEKDFAKTREDYRHDMSTNIENLDKKLADLDARAKQGKHIDGNLAALHQQRNVFVTDAKAIDTADARTWDATKDRLDKEWRNLQDAVDHAH